MAGRSVRVRAAAVWATIAAAVLAVGSDSAAARSSNAVPLHILLTVSSNLTAMAHQALVAEAERIWRRERVRIEWAWAGRGTERPDALLRVLVVSRPLLAANADHEWPVAELVPEATPRAVAFAWISGAERVVQEATRSAAAQTPAPRDYRLGLVLGRAVAHEIGHFLLSTGTHSESGLMRATVDAREFAAVGDGDFSLDPEASQWLRQRLTAATAATSVSEAGFDYLRRPNRQRQISDPQRIDVGSRKPVVANPRLLSR